MQNPELTRLYEPLRAGLARLDEDEREEIFDMIRGDFCIHCGRMYKREGEHCHCQNDE